MREEVPCGLLPFSLSGMLAGAVVMTREFDRVKEIAVLGDDIVFRVPGVPDIMVAKKDGFISSVWPSRFDLFMAAPPARKRAMFLKLPPLFEKCVAIAA